MRIVHLADLHLGYRAYNRVTSQGINRREADVFNAFRAALDKTVEIQPDLIIIAGDLFHSVRPSNLVIQHTFSAFLDLRGKSGAPIIVIGGNHDSPKSVDTGCILDLLANIPDVYVAHSEYSGIRLQNLDTTVFCLCHRALPSLKELKLEPDPQSRCNILTLHGSIEGVARDFTDVYMVRREDILSDAWDYVACGHFHIRTRLADNAFYSGSTEFTSFNIWEERETPKGFVEYDTDSRQMTPHELPTRPVIELNTIDAGGLTAAEVNDSIERRVAGIDGGHTDKIIRLVVENLPRQAMVDLDYALVRQIKAEALHFELQCRRPGKDGKRADNARAQTRPLEVEWREFIGDNVEIPGGVERAKLLELGLQYLAGQEIPAE
ncbi:MAG: DNA repair exonuclease [Armatimonadota bacterium]|nr:DNA repair exonuclease [Armatimonadota bacterium]